MDYLLSQAMQPNYIKIMLLVLHKLNEDSSKVTELSISLLNSSIPMSFRRKVKLKFNRFGNAII